jgi:hypothetical protein
MRHDIEKSFAKAAPVHPHQWLWETLANEPSFVLRTMFGAKAVYLDGKLMLCFCAREEPWLGVLVATDKARQAALLADFPELKPHPILPKWLYLPESADTFERTAMRLVVLARRRDARIGIIPPPRKRGRAKPAPRRRPR